MKFKGSSLNFTIIRNVEIKRNLSPWPGIIKWDGVVSYNTSDVAFGFIFLFPWQIFWNWSDAMNLKGNCRCDGKAFVSSKTTKRQRSFDCHCFRCYLFLLSILMSKGKLQIKFIILKNSTLTINKSLTRLLHKKSSIPYIIFKII